MFIKFCVKAGMFLLLAVFAFGCQPEHLKGFKKTKSGLYYKFHESNPDSAKVGITDIITVQMSYSVNDTVIFDSKEMERPMQFPLIPSIFKGDFYEGILMMHKGDSASFQCPADSVILKVLRAKKLPDFVHSGDMMLIHVRLKNFYTKEQFNIEKKKFLEEMQARGNMLLSIYKQQNNVTQVPEESGLIILHQVYGKGKSPVQGSKVKVNYTGTFTDGTIFDSSYDQGKPFEFTVGRNEVIPGWDEGIKKIKVGGKVKLIIPANLAYGERNVGQIPPHTPLIFDIELLEILN
ncbi:MAG: FKBP-type peptidyl-prolyl cis-trans isomerase [Bacteroidales bacterium]|nr:FKBP-type peptidyl-prolyl cis-trans isomerase [Bacteroidales bacterium]